MNKKVVARELLVVAKELVADKNSDILSTCALQRRLYSQRDAIVDRIRSFADMVNVVSLPEEEDIFGDQKESLRKLQDISSQFLKISREIDSLTREVGGL